MQQLADKDKLYQEQINKQNREIQEMKFKEFFDVKVREGKLVPAQQEMVKALYFMALENETSIEFGEGTDKKTAKGGQILEALINTLEKKVEFNEVATGEQYNPNEFAEQDKFIQEHFGGK